LKWVGVAVLAMAITAPPVEATGRNGSVKPSRQAQRAATTIDNGTHMDANNLDMVVTNHGSIAYDLITGNAGLIYPKGGTRTSVFAAGLWIGAKVAGEIRTAVGEYSQEFTPGPMAGGTFQPDIPAYKNYKILRGNTTSSDYLNWPVADGAPTDSMGNPLLLGDATIWSVFNDADPGTHTNDAGSTAPLGLEVQQTVFAYNRAGPLGNIIFIKWKFINKGADTLDSTYVSVWSDPDLGGFTDDLVGCDVPRSMGYCYNATNQDGQYGGRPPAIGYDFFRGPIVFNGATYDTLGMTSFNKYINGTDPSSADETYNNLQGLAPDGSTLLDCTAAPTKFQVAGDPVTSTGCLDSNPADRRLMLSSGPFTMAPGDSQEVVTAIIIGQGADRLSSIADLRAKDDVAQIVFNLNFDIPAPPPAPTIYAQPLDKGVRLVWGSEPVGDVQIQANLGQEFHFEGFRVWQMSSNSAEADPTVVATYDEANGVTSIFSDEFNSGSGVVERTLKAAGTDHGLEFQIDITNDAIRGGKLVNNKNYYYAVTAYSYDVNNAPDFFVNGVSIGNVSEILESARNPIPASPRTSSAVYSVGATAVTSDPLLNQSGDVSVDQLIQNDITGNLYEVTLNDSEEWTLRNVTTNTTLLVDQTNIGGDYDNPVTEGFMARVTAPRELAIFGEVDGGGNVSDMTAAQPDSTGQWHFSNRGGLGIYSFLYPDNHNYEIRFTATPDQYVWGYASGEVSFVDSYQAPIEAWDLGADRAPGGGDDTKATVMIRDLDLSGSLTWGDRIYIRNIDYGTVAWTTPGTKSTDYVADGTDQVFGGFQLAKDTHPGDSPDPTTIRLIAQRFTSADSYQFTTQRVGTASGSVVGRDLKKVLAVPNPYYARSSYELTQFDRVMKFTNIPASRLVTLRIFNLGGDLVRVLRREATTPDEQAVATLQWDLNTDSNLPVASGIYLYRLDVDGVGSKTDRIAVFIEQERLDNF
jgi:hypothetical protein